MLEVSALLIYITVQCITPGPSNLMSLYTATTLGFSSARGFRLGSASGFLVKILLCGLLNMALASVLPGIVPSLKVIGALYLMYLCFHIALSSVAQSDDSQEDKKHVSANFVGGIMLQVLNMKSWIMGITLFSTYVIPYTTRMRDMVLWALITTAFMFAATIIWSLVGTAIKKAYAKYRLNFDCIFAALLLYSAISALI